MTSHVSIAGKDIGFPCAADERILDAAERAGYTMAYSCRKGVCETCRGTLTKGSVKLAPFGSRRQAGDEILCCMAIPDGPVEIAPPWIEKRRQPDRSRVSALVHKIVERSPDVSEIQLRLPIGRRVAFSAGQYVTVLMEDGNTRNYSMANAPQKNDIVDLHVRRIQGGLFSDRILRNLAPGSCLDLELPFGLFTWSEHFSRPAVLLATGTGFAPLKSMIQDLVARGVDRPVHLFWGGEREADIYDLALTRAWAEALPWFKVTPVLASPDAAWGGATGFVQDAVLAHYDNLAGHEVYACGNPMMIDQARALLVARAAAAGAPGG